MKQFILFFPIALSIVSSTLSAHAIPLSNAVIISKPIPNFNPQLLNPQPLPPKNFNLNIRQLNPQPLPPKKSIYNLRNSR
jgi:hypothetical protein